MKKYQVIGGQYERGITMKRNAYSDAPVFYHAEVSRSGKMFIVCEPLTPYTMTGDYLLFSSYDACKKYCEENGWEVA